MLEHKELDRLIPLFALLAQMDAVYAPASSTYSTAFPVSPAFTGHAGTRPIRSLVPSKERAQIPIQSIHCCYLCLCCWLNKINWRFLKTKNEVKDARVRGPSFPFPSPPVDRASKACLLDCFSSLYRC
uniref:Uncharacterized protein n=1 Tax=Picea glauca TaxID=3330 RepID=A0A117NJB5_PICGL|nr:hypothetical protein ABT39_MTgene1093 [Picea glauca]